MTRLEACLAILLLTRVTASSQEEARPDDVLQLKDGRILVGRILTVTQKTVEIRVNGEKEPRLIPFQFLMPYSVYRLKLARADSSNPSSRFELGKFCYECKLYTTALREFQRAAERYSELDDAGRKARAPVREKEAQVLLGYVKTLLSEDRYRMASVYVRLMAKGYGDTTPFAEAKKLEAEQAIKSRIVEEVFTRIEKRIQEAKTIRIKFNSETTSIVNGEQSRYTDSGLLLAQQGNKVNVSGLMVRTEGIVQNKNEYSFVSDGTRMDEWYSRGRERTTSSTPGHLDTQIRTLLVRLGPALIIEYLDRESTNPKTAAQRFVASDLKALPDEGARRGLSYQLHGMNGEEVRVTLWYEAESYRLISRIAKLISSSGVGESTTTESYEEFILNKDLPVDSFKLPER